MFKLTSAPSKGPLLRFSQKNNSNHIFSTLAVCVPEHKVIRSDLDQYQLKRRHIQKKSSYSVAIYIDYPLLPVEDVGCN